MSMLQKVAGKDVFVADLKELPPLPLTYEDTPELKPYAWALETAIRTGLITGPGKYGVEINEDDMTWNVYLIIED